MQSIITKHKVGDSVKYSYSKEIGIITEMGMFCAKVKFQNNFEGFIPFNCLSVPLENSCTIITEHCI